MEKEKLYSEAAGKFGVKNQIIKTIEELSELQKALCKYILYVSPDEYEKLLKNIVEEIADVEIMTEQLKLIFSFDVALSDLVEKQKRLKLERLKNLL